MLLAAVAVFAADDPWAKVKELKGGAELRVYKKGAAQPLLAKMDELTDDNLMVVVKRGRWRSPGIKSSGSTTGRRLDGSRRKRRARRPTRTRGRAHPDPDRRRREHRCRAAST